MAKGQLGKGDSCKPAAPRSQLQNSQRFLFLPCQKSIDNILSAIDEKISCDFLSLPHPVARGVHIALKMQHLLVIRKRGALLQKEDIMRVGGSDVLRCVMDLLFEEFELLLLAFGAQGTGKDDILQLQPVLTATRLLLFHLIQLPHLLWISMLTSLFLALLSPTKRMSRISSAKKIQSSWKISDSSKIYPNEVSMRDSKTLLPEKFSPVKNHSKESRIFNTSKDKLSLLKNNSSQSQAMTPRSRDNTVLFSSNHLNLKDSIQLQESPQKTRLNRPELSSKQSLILKNLESESPQKVVKTSNFNHQLLKSANDFNRQAINKIKMEFYSFRAQIWAELMEQREMITKMASELGKQLQVIRNSDGKRVDESVFDCRKSVEVSPKIESINEQINAFTSSIGKYEQVEQAQVVIEEHLPHVEIVPFEQQYIEKPINGLQSEKQVRTPIAKLEQISKIPQKRSSPLDKCTQIAETIGILNEINSSPVSHSKAKSIQKLTIQEYKQKLLSICRSNEQLIKQPTRSAVPASESQLKLKGNFKLDKFYSAIQKLKSQVNQIRNINEMKQIKKLKIVQVNE